MTTAGMAWPGRRGPEGIVPNARLHTMDYRSGGWRTGFTRTVSDQRLDAGRNGDRVVFQPSLSELLYFTHTLTGQQTEFEDV